MRDEWYVARRGPDGNRRYGPVPLRQLRDLMNSGRVGADDLIWREGMAEWQPVDQCPELAAPPSRPHPAYGGAAYGAAPGAAYGPYGPYGQAPVYRRPYPPPSSSSGWVLPVIIVGGVVALGLLGVFGVFCAAMLNHSSAPAGYTSPSTYTIPTQPIAPDPVFVPPDPGFVQPDPVWVPPPDPVFVPPDPVFVPPPDPPFNPDPDPVPPPDDPKPDPP